MAQLSSTNIYGNLGVSGNATISGTLTAKASSAAYADSAGSVSKAAVTAALGYTPPTTDTTYGNFVGATTTKAGSAGLVIAPGTGDTAKFLGNGGWTALPALSGATTTKAGSAGLVPAPGTGDTAKFLRGNGTWDSTPYPSVFVGATTTKAGSAGLVPAPGTGDTAKYLANGGWTALPTLSGATTTKAGSAGLVIAPGTGDTAKFLRGDGTWADDNNNKVAQNNSADNANYRVLLSNTANNTDETASAKKSGNLCFNPSSGLLSTVKIDVSGSAGHANTLFSVTDSASLTSNQISHSARFYNSNMAAGAANALLVGKEGSSKNSAYIGFYYAGSGSNDNYLRLGHYAADNQMIIKAGGNVGINTTAPSYKLDVNGDIRSQSKAYIGTGGVYISYNSTSQALEFNV